MTRRFFDADVWQALRKLEPSLKMIYFYIWSKCDPAGVYTLDEEYMKIDTGISFQKNDFEKLPCVMFLSPDKILLTDFVEVNYVKLKEGYNPHKPVFRALEKNGLNPETLKPYDFKLGNIISKLEEEGEEEEEDKGEEEDKKGKSAKKTKTPPQELAVVYPWLSEVFITAWAAWMLYKKTTHKFQYKNERSIQMALKELVRISGNDEETAILILERSEANGWEGMIPLPKDHVRTVKQSQTSKLDILREQGNEADDFLNLKYQNQ